MSEITFEEFCSRLVDDKIEALQVMAKEAGVVFHPNLGREKLLERMYAHYTKQEDVPSDKSGDKTLPDMPGEEDGTIVYEVVLRSTKDRYRGGRRWAVGRHRVPCESLSEKDIEELKKDKLFSVDKIKIIG